MIAVLGIVLTIGVVNGRKMLRGQEERASLATFQQSVWQGATAAAARGRRTELLRQGERLVLREMTSQAVIRSFDLATTVTTNLPSGQFLVFDPPGKIDSTSLAALPRPLTMSTENQTYALTVSLIGEVKVEAHR